MKNFQNLKNLENKVVVVTGASSGLGEQTAYQLARKGAIVVACARSLDRLKTVAKACTKFRGKKAYAVRVDVAQPDQIEQAVRKIETEIGSIDVLINDAGFGLMQDAISFDMEVAEKMFRVNVLGTIYFSKFVALRMAKRNHGMIINIASIAGKISTPKSSVYSATKAAVLGYSNALRLELKSLGISVMTVNPGPIRTKFFDKADESGTYLKKIEGIVLNPELVAEKIVNSIGTTKRELNLPYFFNLANVCYTLFPRLGDFLAAGIFNRK